MDEPDISSDMFQDFDGNEAQGSIAIYCTICGARLDEFSGVCPDCDADEESGLRDACTASTVSIFGPCIWLYLLLLGVLLTGAVLLQFGVINELGFNFIFSCITSVLIVLWLIRYHRSCDLFLKNICSAWWFLGAAAAGCFTFIAAHYYADIVNSFFQMEGLLYSRVFLEADYGIWTIILFVCVVPGIFEELAFRGIIQGALMKNMGAIEAIIVSAFMFMLLHLTVLSFPFLFLMGIILGYFRYKTGSVYPGILMHFVHNFLVVMSEFYGV